MKLEQNFVKYFVRFLGNGVSRKNVFEITDLQPVSSKYNTEDEQQKKLAAESDSRKNIQIFRLCANAVRLKSKSLYVRPAVSSKYLELNILKD